jgi:dTMP kinase
VRGRFITFEGGEGCGKSTQLGRLARALEAEGIGTVSVREPGGTPLCERVRELLKEKTSDPPCDESELLLFLASRAQLVRSVIVPALETGKWVLCDRFSDSTVAYQGYGRGLDMEFLCAANAFACGGTKPDLTLFLDVDAETALARRRRREQDTGTCADRIELAGGAFHRRLAEGFRRIAAAEPGRVVTVDASGTEDEVWEKVWKSLKRLR